MVSTKPIKKTATVQSQPVSAEPTAPVSAAQAEPQLAQAQAVSAQRLVQEETEELLEEGQIDDLGERDAPPVEAETVVPEEAAPAQPKRGNDGLARSSQQPTAPAEAAVPKPVQAQPDSAVEAESTSADTRAPAIIFKQFAQSATQQGATVFEDGGAREVAALLGVELSETPKSNGPFVVVTQQQIDQVLPTFESQGRSVEFVQPEPRGTIFINQVRGEPTSATVYEEAAQAAAEFLNVSVDRTQQGNQAKLKLALDQVDEIEQLLHDQGFKDVKREARNFNPPPKLTVYTPDDGDSFVVSGKAAEWVAASCDQELSHSPSGVPTMQFDRAEWKQVKQQLQADHPDLDLTQKDLKVKLVVDERNGKVMTGEILGIPAQDVAALLDLKPQWVEGKNGPFAKLVLEGNQVEEAKAHLAPHYEVRVEMKEVQSLQFRTLEDGQVLMTGNDAREVSDRLDIPFSTGTKGPYLKLDPEQAVSLQQDFESEGRDFQVSHYQAKTRSTEPRSQESSSPKPKPKQKATAGMEL